MSDSTRVSHRRKKQRSSPFVALSLALHVGGLGLLMLYAPTREAILGKALPKAEPEVRLEGDALADITEQIRDINKEKLVSAAIELQSVQQEMEDLRTVKAQEFAEFAKSQYEGSLQQLQDTIKKVVESQQVAITEQSQAKSAEESANSHRDSAARSQSAAESGQQTLTDLLEFGGASESLKKQQDEASAAQVQATRAMATASQGASAVRGAQAKQKETTEALPKEEEAVKKEAALLQEAQARQQELQTKLDAAKQAKDAAAEQLATAEATTKPADKNAVKAHADALRRSREAAKRAQDEVNRVAKAATDAQKTTERREQLVKAAEEKLEKAKETADAARKQIAEREQQFAEKTKTAMELQEKAKALQEQANEHIAKALAANELKGPHMAADPRTPKGISLSEASIGEVYEFLVDSEKDVARSYGEYRATDLAMLTKVSPRRALQQIDIPQANRPTIDRELTEQKITEGEQYRRHTEAVQTALRESDSIVAAARNMLDQAYAARDRGVHGASVSLEDRSRRAAAIAKASHEVEGGQVADLSELMRQNAALPKPAAGAGADMGEMARPSARSTGRPPEIRDVDVARGARTITASAAGAKWVYVDSWYMVGPFANPGRANIHRSFGPESTINLDAIYDGMFGPVRWRFTQSPRVMVSPPNECEYGIWYAYTELNFDEAQDLWIAVGSDDRSDIWINDVRVWSSSDILKGWQIGEGLRRVHFEQGRNRILYRLENGWNTCGFSLCIYTGGGAVK